MSDRPTTELEDYDEKMQQLLRETMSNSKKSLGFYVYLLFVAGAIASIAIHGTWSVLWSVLVFIPMMVICFAKTAVWDWTEEKLKRDAEEGRFKRAVRWDYFCVFIDWAAMFAVFAMSTFAVFALADGRMPDTAAWLCVGALSPLLRADYYHWGNYAFWSQNATVATAILSAFMPVPPALGLTFQVATAFLSLPLSWLSKRDEIWGKVDGYFQAAKAARVMYAAPPPAPPQAPTVEALKSALANCEYHWTELAAAAAMAVAGLAWLLCLHMSLAPLVAVPAYVLGVLVKSMLVNPTTMPDDELARRGLDIDLAGPFFHLRALFIMFALFIASATVLWIGGRDVNALSAMSLLASGFCGIASTADIRNGHGAKDPSIVYVYPLALAAVVALRLCSMAWWECLTPIPLISCLQPAFRWFFPCSGLRGEERRAAIEDMPRRIAADIRTAAEKALDAKREKRRLRDARRVARIKKG